MTTIAAGASRTPMSWEDYLALDDDVRGEYCGGEFVVSASAQQDHQTISLELAILLRSSLSSDLKVTQDWGWSPDGVTELLIPDLMVHARTTEKAHLSAVPSLVVEIVSVGRHRDLVEKVSRYAAWGAPVYWVVDPRHRELLVFEGRDGVFERTATHRAADEPGTRVVCAYRGGEVELDLAVLFDV